MSKDEKLDELCKLLKSLLVARKGATPLAVLEKDYREEESKRIPYHQFGFTDLVAFFQSMPQHFFIEHQNGMHYIRATSDKSNHVSSLVARQRTSQKPPRYIAPHLRQPFHRRAQFAKSQQIKIAPDKLLYLMRHIQENPHGVSLQTATAIVQRIVPFVKLSPQELRVQLYELSHELYVDGNMIYSKRNNDLRNVIHQQPLIQELQSELQSDSRSLAITQTECAAGQENFDLQCFSDDDDDNFLPANYHAEMSEQFATNRAQYANCEQTETFNKLKSNDTEIGKNFATNSNSKMKTATECYDLSQIVNDRIKSRLEQLMQKNPEGIWCADLPNAYLHEYKVPLNYSQLGFASVREFTSFLPKIFYMKQINKTEDFILYSADKRPIVPKSDPIDITQTSHNQYGKHSTAQCGKNDDEDDDNAPIPSDVVRNKLLLYNICSVIFFI